MSREIPTKEYIQDGGDSGPYGCHPYQRGSRHNKIGMWILWTYYLLFIGMFIRSLLIFLKGTM